jgi:hypothetical protein
MATLTTLQVLQAGTVPATVSAAAGGDKVVPGDNVWLEVTNGGGAPITVTATSGTVTNYGTNADLVVTVANGATKRIGPLSAQRFAAVADGLVAITYSAVTTVTVAAWRI